MAHFVGQTNNKNTTLANETRRNIGTIPSQERFHVGDQRIPFKDLHLRFVNDGSNKIKIRLDNEIKNVTMVTLESLYVNTLTPFVFSAGLKFTKSSDYFYPSSVHGSGNLPDHIIWTHPKFERTVTGAGKNIISDENQRVIATYRQATTFSTFEVSLIDENGANVNWAEATINLKLETLDWQ